MRTPEDLMIENRPIGELKPYKKNARTHSEAQIRQIASSMKTFGFTNPVLIDKTGTIIAGHGRVLAAELLGMKVVPTIRLEHLSKEQIRAYIIADNKLAENAGWDMEILATEFEALNDMDLDFDLEITGFETPEIDLMIQSLTAEDSDDTLDEVVEEPDTTIPPVTSPGDLWILGDHRVYCGDALDKESFDVVLEGEEAQMVFTDPPYNVSIEGNVSGKGTVKHEDFAMASGEMTQTEFALFLEQVMRNMCDHSANGALHYICMDWRHIKEMSLASGSVYDRMINLAVWNKTNAGMGSFYRSKHELIFVFKCGNAKHINHVELGRHGRNRTNVWDYAGANGFTASRDDDLTMHPTVKPVALIADAILDASHRDGIILDPFGGSGSTLMAAEKTGRKARLIEIDPHYVDTIIRRFEKETGMEAVHADTGRPFSAPKKQT